MMGVWLNGHFVGYSEDSFTPSEFELTEYVKEGENKLAAQVLRDLVLSTIIPINRSLNASQSFATKKTIPTNPGDTFNTSVK